MTTLKEKVFNRITDDFQVMAREVFQQLELADRMMENNKDEQLYNTLVTNERIIDSLEVKMRSEVINAIVLYTPRATNLRVIISYYDMTAYLERIGDQVLNIANFLKSADIHNTLFGQYKDELKEMLCTATRMAKNSIQAFTDGRTELAKEVIELDDQVDDLFHRISRELPEMQSGKVLSPQEMTDVLAINGMAYNIERIGDNATNISESAIYLIQGQNIRHLDHQDEANDLISKEN